MHAYQKTKANLFFPQGGRERFGGMFSTICLYMKVELFSKYTADPSICPLHTSSLIPNAQRAPGLVDVVHLDRGGLGLPAGR